MASTVEVLLRKAEEALEDVRGHYDADLASKEVSDDLLYAVRQIVIDCQSALDMTATAVKAKYGSGDWKPYYPIGKTPEAFEEQLKRQIKGLAESHPEIAEAFGRHQPYRPKRAELGYLKVLRKINTHEDFTAQERVEQIVGIRQEFPGAIVEQDLVPHNLRIGPSPGSTDVRLDGSPPLRTFRTIFVDWRFVDPPVSVLPTLEALVQLTRAAVTDIRREAQL